MDKPYEVVIKLLGGDGPCDIGFLPGTDWTFEERTPEGMCTLAFNAMYPLIVGLQNGATFPWQEDPDVTFASYPNPKVNNVYEIRRITKK